MVLSSGRDFLRRAWMMLYRRQAQLRGFAATLGRRISGVFLFFAALAAAHLRRHPDGGGRPHLIPVAFGVVLGIIGLVLAAGGAQLATLGGSWYYLGAGLTMLVSGMLFARRDVKGVWFFAALFAFTVLWSVYEGGWRFWPMVPRLAPMLALGLITALIAPLLTAGRGRKLAFGAAGLCAVILAAGFVAMFYPHGGIVTNLRPEKIAELDAAQGAVWQYYGKSPAGTRFVPLDQINKSNVRNLQVAWTYHTGDVATEGSEEQSTPIFVDGVLYGCTPRSDAYALDAATGKEIWTYKSGAVPNKFWNRCRGVAYYDASAVPAEKRITPVAVSATQGDPAPATECSKRVFMGTVDARLIALDARTGKPCAGFGDNGTIDLKKSMGDVKPFYYMPTSMPTVIRNIVVLGGWISDGEDTNEPSGAVRAFSADTGRVMWIWDIGNPNINEVREDQREYTRSTPNVWSTPAFDDALGLVYLPTGNETPDYWGGHRRQISEQYSSSIVAVDFATGKERWRFQTTHHDVWDYDVAAQPALYDIPGAGGETVPALVQLTKRGQIFMLDRRDGKPLAEVVEKPVPQGPADGDWLSKTQPYSVGMPAIGAEPLRESDMWGGTFFDQLWCRIQFRKMRYQGDFTPPGTDRMLQWPGNFGGFNWGSASIDESTGYLYAADMRVPQWLDLVPREKFDAPGASGTFNSQPQRGAPFGVIKARFDSPLGLPCITPPYGTLTAIDLRTRQIAWQRSIGTIHDLKLKNGRLNIPLGIELGLPTLGGPLTTASGLLFFSGTMDYYVRAFDGATGEELWKSPLPVGSQATPMSYIDPKDGRQYLVLSVGGSRYSPDRGDYVIAYALP